MTNLNERTIFLEAIEFDDASRRSEFVNKVCGDNLDLRASVEELLAAHESSDCMLDRELVEGHPIDESPAFALSEAQSHAMTEHVGTLVGSFRLMELIGEGGLDVDTRSDMYSLGVMLYELLVGTTPFERERLNSAGFDEMRQIIREEEPAMPSHRVSTLGNRLTTVADARRTPPSRLQSALRGDLDWIVMKALEKDWNRRYESAASLAGDLRRFLDQQPIDARPQKDRHQQTRWHFQVIFAIPVTGKRREPRRCQQIAKQIERV